MGTAQESATSMNGMLQYIGFFIPEHSPRIGLRFTGKVPRSYPAEIYLELHGDLAFRLRICLN